MSSVAKESMHEPAISRGVATLLAELHAVDPAARENAVSTLQALDRGAVVDELSRLLGSPDPESRCDAAEALLRIDAHRTIELVLPLVADASGVVRWHTCGLLHDFGDQRAIPWLVRVLSDDPEADVRLIAAHALEEIGDHRALAALRQASQSDDGEDYEGRRVRDKAAEAIQKILARGA
jgi:HEAT repeat protein